MSRSVLASQLGYRPEDPKIIVIRGLDDDEPPVDAALVRSEDGAVVAEAQASDAQRLWGAVFWTVDFTGVSTPGRYVVRLNAGERSNEFDVEDDLLLSRTLLPTSVATLEARVRGKLGWQDCAFDGRGLESHAIVVLGLLDVLALAPQLDDAIRQRLLAQLRHGTEYLTACQREDGSFMNEYYIARDKTTWTLCALGCLALVRAAELLSSGTLLDRAKTAWNWCLSHGSETASSVELDTTRKVFGQYPPWLPPAAPRARDLLLLLRAATELYRNTNDPTYANAATGLARVLSSAYQCNEPSEQNGLYGDFWAWPQTYIHQRGWEHAGWGFNCGAVLPDDVSGFLNLLELFPDHPDHASWRAVLHRYAYGYLRPGCELTPFGIYPLGNCEGEVRFFGPSWHGFNGMYAQVARTCMLLARHLRDQHFENLAQRNLQWIVGANVGTQVADGRYQGLSWISGTGEHCTEVWSGIPGSIANGFCATPQFRLEHLDDVLDAPTFETREDWLVHNGSWLSGLAQVSTRPRLKVRVQDAGRLTPATVSLALGDASFQAQTNARGVVIFQELPRLRCGTLEVSAGERRLQLPVEPISGDSLDLVIDLSETLRVEWELGVDGDQPSLLITNLGAEPATAQLELSVVTDAPTSVTELCELPAGQSIIWDLPVSLARSVTGSCWLRAVVTGRFSVAAAETSYLVKPTSKSAQGGSAR